MSNIASIKFNVTIELEFKYKIFDATNNILKLTIKQMNHKDVISTCPISEDFYEKIRDITKEWAGMYKEKNTRTLDGESWNLIKMSKLINVFIKQIVFL